MIACILYPRFALLAAMEGRGEALRQPAVLAPEPGGRQLVGEVSASAEAFGIVAGMRMGEALGAPGFRAPPPAGLLRSRPELAELPDVLDRLGIRTLGDIAALPPAAM